MLDCCEQGVCLEQNAGNVVMIRFEERRKLGQCPHGSFCIHVSP